LVTCNGGRSIRECVQLGSRCSACTVDPLRRAILQPETMRTSSLLST
jgi:hypothetical protein